MLSKAEFTKALKTITEPTVTSSITKPKDALFIFENYFLEDAKDSSKKFLIRSFRLYPDDSVDEKKRNSIRICKELRIYRRWIDEFKEKKNDENCVQEV